MKLWLSLNQSIIFLFLYKYISQYKSILIAYVTIEAVFTSIAAAVFTSIEAALTIIFVAHVDTSHTSV